ncbi:hypothetical protein QY97_02847 [Bacillus thermotolerans]|uniref:Uncharacterized protein n=1 Tax=Bacillus thermotolerans TaxID=1221996 RepID=A0A0F5HY52_BACTR|nr:hypothetical protein QY97_02847 [Bacillus thermotolerans]KKB39861.1 hypothetical protein QY95_02078 [Bacillus thermotolerans]KKB44298.1 hypothetical protein QY96_03320 [Bacillus thermotolerans]
MNHINIESERKEYNPFYRQDSLKLSEERGGKFFNPAVSVFALFSQAGR